MTPTVASLITSEEALAVVAPIQAACETEASRLIAVACRAARESLRESDDSGGVVTGTVSAYIRAALKPLLTEDLAGVLASAIGSEKNVEAKIMTRLHRVGDVCKTSDSRWHAAPTRLVFLGPGSRHALLLGSEPTRMISAVGAAGVLEWGFLRLVRRREIDSTLRTNESAWQSVIDWLALPRISLQEWASHFMDARSRTLAIGEPPGATNIEIYSVSRGVGRWRSIDEAHDALYLALCRSDMRQGMAMKKIYWLAALDVQSKPARVRASSVISRNDALRLGFAIESRAVGAKSLSYQIDNDSVIVRVVAPLPYPEAKITEISLHRGKYEHYWPRFILPLVTDVFASLDISLVPSNAGL